MLRKAKCVTLSIAGRGSNIFRNTDKEPFLENQVNNFDELLKSGAIVLVEENKETKEVEKPKTSKK